MNALDLVGMVHTKKCIVEWPFKLLNFHISTNISIFRYTTIYNNNGSNIND